MRQRLFCIGWKIVYLFCFLLDEARRREVTVAIIRQEGYDGLTSVFRTFCDFRSGIEAAPPEIPMRRPSDSVNF